MNRTREEKLLNPRPGSKIAAAVEYGIDMTQLVENLRRTPAERVRRNDEVVNSVRKIAAAVSKAKAAKAKIG